MRYAIFDLDGTLVDSMGYWRNFGKWFLIENGYVKESEFDTIEDVERIDGTKWVESLCDYFCTKYNIDITPSEFMKWGLDFMRKQYKNVVKFKPGAKGMLDKFLADGVKMCICSSTDRELMEPLLKRLDLDKYFEFTIHCRQYGKEKNNPTLFTELMQKLGAEKPEEVCVFEDALYSAKTAFGGGFYTVGIFDETEPNKAEMEKCCKQYVYDWNELDYSKLPE